jgi:hypothetical protein
VRRQSSNTCVRLLLTWRSLGSHKALTGYSRGTHGVLRGTPGSSRVLTGYSGDSARHSRRDGRAGIRALRSAGRRCEHCASRLKGHTVSTRYALTWNSWGTHGVLKGYSRGTQGVLKRNSSGTQAELKARTETPPASCASSADPSASRRPPHTCGERTGLALLRFSIPV